MDMALMVTLLIFSLFVGMAIFWMVMDIAHWKRKGPAGFEVGEKGERE